MSPLLLERYMSVARQVSRLAVGDTTMMVAPSTYPIDSSMKQTDRENEDLPFGSRGFSIKHTFPLDGEYVIQIRLKRTQNEYIRGLGRKPQPIEVRVDGVRLKMFAEAGLMKGVPPVEGFTQSDLGTPDWEKNSLDGDNDLQVRFPAKAGTRVIAFAIPARRWNPDESFVLPPRAGREEERDGNIAIKQVEIAGPFNAKPPGRLGQPPEDLHLPAEPARPTGSVRDDDSDGHRPQGVSPSARQGRRAGAAPVLPRRHGTRLRRLHSVGPGADPGEPLLPVPCRGRRFGFRSAFAGSQVGD